MTHLNRRVDLPLAESRQQSFLIGIVLPLSFLCIDDDSVNSTLYFVLVSLRGSSVVGSFLAAVWYGEVIGLRSCEANDDDDDVDDDDAVVVAAGNDVMEWDGGGK